jgi:hypothetical protein
MSGDVKITASAEALTEASAEAKIEASVAVTASTDDVTKR